MGVKEYHVNNLPIAGLDQKYTVVLNGYSGRWEDELMNNDKQVAV